MWRPASLVSIQQDQFYLLVVRMVPHPLSAAWAPAAFFVLSQGQLLTLGVLQASAATG